MRFFKSFYIRTLVLLSMIVILSVSTYSLARMYYRWYDDNPTISSYVLSDEYNKKLEKTLEQLRRLSDAYNDALDGYTQYLGDKYYVDNKDDFIYYLNVSGNVFTNQVTNLSDMLEKPFVKKYENDYTSDNTYHNAYVLYIAPAKKYVDEYYDKLSNKESIDKKYTGRLILYIIPAVIVVIMTSYLLIFGRYSYKETKVPLEIILAVIGGIIYGIYVVSGINPQVARETSVDMYGQYNILCFVFAFGVTLAYMIMYLSVNTFIVRCQNRTVIRYTLIYAIINEIYRGIKKLILIKTEADNNMLFKHFLIRTTIFGVLLSVYGVVANVLLKDVDSLVKILGYVIICIAYVFATAYELYDMGNVIKHIRDISDGDYSIKDVNERSYVRGVERELNSIAEGIVQTVESELKSERMKVELITNVSHDLKTPLTSIISYVNLLKHEDMSPVARDYVEILDKKSDRLKKIVSEVFDLAKATSNTDVYLEEIDEVILVEQVFADMADRIAEGNRKIEKNIQVESALILGEGQKLYRILQNLIDNAIKYSMEGTRIFIKLYKEGNEYVCTVKNVASYEMNFEAESIMERFTRADESRTTEGSGLGLAIAKSFAEACGGKLSISIDGDMFIAEFRFKERKEI